MKLFGLINTYENSGKNQKTDFGLKIENDWSGN